MRKNIARVGAMAGAAVLALSATAANASAVTPTGKARGATTVTLDASTIGAVVGLGLTPASVGPAVLGGSPLQATFPITGKFAKNDIVRHVGGLSLTDSMGRQLALTNYRIDLSRGVLTAQAAVNGADVGRVDLFDLGAAPEQDGCAATAELTLDAQAAGALTMVFGAPDLTGADFGTACVAPR
ncbi:MAG TPA: hypothetical protein VLV82_00145 [Candidatus Angelobacter sp.]|nr:hypothetical protein [Candidatus Angelobacter sp.]